MRSFITDVSAKSFLHIYMHLYPGSVRDPLVELLDDGAFLLEEAVPLVKNCKMGKFLTNLVAIRVGIIGGLEYLHSELCALVIDPDSSCNVDF
jgi:hypothetical protein